MKKRKYTDLVIDIDSVFYRIGDKDLRLLSHEIIKNWFNTLKEHYNIYLVSNKLSFREVEKRLKYYKIQRIPKDIYCFKDNIDFRRSVIEKLMKYETNDKTLSSVLFISGNPYFIASKEDLGITTCYVRELNKEYKEATIGNFMVDKVGAITSLGLYQNTDNQTSKNAKKNTTKNLNIRDYIYIIGSGYDLIAKEEFNKNAIFTREYNDTDIKDTLAISDNPLELWNYIHRKIDTLFINNGHNDIIDMMPTYEKKLKV